MSAVEGHGAWVGDCVRDVFRTETTRPPEEVPGVVLCVSFGAPGGTRTHDLQVRNLALYPLSYGRNLLCSIMNGLAEREGFEPSRQVTPPGGLANRCTRPLCDLSEGHSRSNLAYRTSLWVPLFDTNDPESCVNSCVK